MRFVVVTTTVAICLLAGGCKDAGPTVDPCLDKSVAQYSSVPDQGLDAEKKAYAATIDTVRGKVRIQLFPDAAPLHVNSFVFLAREGFFDCLVFHRVVPGFVAQAGDPMGNGNGGPGYNLPAEFNADNPVPHRFGTFAAARTPDPNSAGSQFYIVLEDGPSASNLDGQYTVFGHVISGMSVARKLQVGDKILSVTIDEGPKADAVVTADDVRAGRLPDND